MTSKLANSWDKPNIKLANGIYTAVNNLHQIPSPATNPYLGRNMIPAKNTSELSNAEPIHIPGSTRIKFYNRVFEHPKTKFQIYASDNFEIAKNGKDEKGRLVVYCPQIFHPLITDYYEEIKYHPTNWLSENGLIAGDDEVKGYYSARIDLGALLLFGVPVELQRLSSEYICLAFQVDDYLETERTGMYKNIRETVIGQAIRVLLGETISDSEKEELQEEIKKCPTCVTPGCIPGHANTYFGDTSARANSLVRTAELLVANCKKLLNPAQQEIYFDSIRWYIYKSQIQMDYVYDLEQKGKIPTIEQYFNTRADSIGSMALYKMLAFAGPDELLKPYNDGLTHWLSYIISLINDVYSYEREKEIGMHFFNLANIARCREPELSEFDALVKVTKLFNQQVFAFEQIVSTMDEVNRVHYISIMHTCFGSVEYNNLNTRYGWLKVEGEDNPHEHIIHEGVSY